MNIQQLTIHNLFEQQVQKSPRATAAKDGKKSMSYNQLNKKANQLAHYLINKGLQPDTPVAICMERSFNCIITILAILKAGGAYLPLDAENPKERLIGILNNSSAPYLITTETLANQFFSYQGIIINLDAMEQQINKLPKNNPNVPLQSNNLAYIIYTSGSTGSPKGVLIEHASVINYCHWYADYCALNAKDNIDFSSKHTFDMAVSISIIPLMLGATLILCPDAIKKNIHLYLNHLKKNKVSLIKLTPSFFKLLIAQTNAQFIALPHLKSIVLGGENLLTDDCKAWLKMYPKHVLYNEYGPTETTVAVSQFKVTYQNVTNLQTNVPIGYLGTNMHCLILNEQGNKLTNGEVGELFIGGTCVARGYLNQPQLTAKQFIIYNNMRFYKTGDLCSQNNQGLLEYFGRIDSQIKIRGFRVEPGEIERHLASFPSIQSVFVTTQNDSTNQPFIVAYYSVTNDDSMPNPKELRYFLQSLIPEYMIPTAFVEVDSFPLNANGKLDKALLPLPKLSASQPFKEASTEIEKILKAIWVEELGIEQIGVEDDFFELGGHSLTAARIISKIINQLNKDVSLAHFYQTPTIRALAKQLESLKKRRKQHSFKKFAKQFTQIPLCNFQLMLWLSNTFEPKAKKINIILRKRFNGQLDKLALEYAFNSILKKQEALRYKMSKFKPAQLVQTHSSFNLLEINLEYLAAHEAQPVLDNSMNQLRNFYPWPKDSALLKAKLFHLENSIDELQISMPHIISDDFSPEIILSNLSKYYLHYQANPAIIKNISNDQSYKEYVLYEQELMQSHLDEDTNFWDNYLKDTGLFVFPKQFIQEDMYRKPYSSYIRIPEQALEFLKSFCSAHHISIKDGLCAAVTLALHQCVRNKQYTTPFIYVNVVKSTRNKEQYDDIIGCFLRLEPVKVSFNQQSTFISVALDIHQSTLETSPHQQCPDLIKMSSISNFRQKKSILKEYVLNMLVTLYAQIFSFSQINLKILQACALRLNSVVRHNEFLINVNVHKDFIAPAPINCANLFGLDTVDISPPHQDLLTIDNILDVCFTRDEQGVANLVLSSNLKMEVRVLIAQQIVGLLSDKALLSTSPSCNLEGSS